MRPSAPRTPPLSSRPGLPGVLASLCLSLAAAFAVHGQAQLYNVGTAAGGGPIDGAAALAPLTSPDAVAVDGAGNLYVAYRDISRVYRVTPAGVLQVLAGNSASSGNAPSGPATLAALGWPVDLALDAAGNVYIADYLACRVLRVDAVTGLIGTYAGNGGVLPNGDGGPATSAALGRPQGLAFDLAGNLYISGEGRIRRVAAGTGLIGTYAGNGTYAYGGDGGPATSASLNGPLGMAVDGGGNLLIADTSNHRIRVVNTAGTISTLAGTGVVGSGGDGGPAGSAQFNSPSDVAVDGSGIYVVDRYNHRVRRIDGATGVISRVAGSTGGWGGDGVPATAAQLYYPTSVARDAGGNLYVADLFNRRVRRVTPDGLIATVAGNGGPGVGETATNVPLTGPESVAIDSSNKLWIGNATTLLRVDRATGVVSTPFASIPGAPFYLAGFVLAGTFDDVVAADGSASVWALGGATGQRIRLAGTGASGYSGDGGPATSARLWGPSDVAVDGLNNIYIADRNNHRVRWVEASTGIIRTLAGTGVAGSSGDGGPAASAQLSSPRGLAMLGDEFLLIADSGNHRIRAVDLVGHTITTAAGTGSPGFSGDGGPATSAKLYAPSDVAVDSVGNIYVSDTYNRRVRKFGFFDTTIRTIAGGGQSGFPGYAGDDGPGPLATLNEPGQLSVDRRGVVYVTEPYNRRVRAIFPRSAKGDLDGDGRTDLLLQNVADGTSQFWLMNGVTRRATGALPTDVPHWPIQASDDFNRDGKTDLVVRTDSGQLAQFLSFLMMNGTTPLGPAVPLLAPGVTIPTNWKLSATADFNRDGRPDLLWRNQSSQALVIWTMNGVLKTGSLVPTPAFAADANWEPMAALDLDDDGNVDLLWYNSTSGRLVVWFMDSNVARIGGGVFTEPQSAGNANWRAVAAGDYGTGSKGLPGTKDIVWRNSTSGRLVVWHMDRGHSRTSGVFTTPNEPGDPLAWTVVGPK